jgi:hypothetical protein
LPWLRLLALGMVILRILLLRCTMALRCVIAVVLLALILFSAWKKDDIFDVYSVCYLLDPVVVRPLVLAVFTGYDYRLALEEILDKLHVAAAEGRAFVPDRFLALTKPARCSDGKAYQLLVAVVVFDLCIATDAPVDSEFSHVHLSPP